MYQTLYPARLSRAPDQSSVLTTVHSVARCRKSAGLDKRALAWASCSDAAVARRKPTHSASSPDEPSMPSPQQTRMALRRAYRNGCKKWVGMRAKRNCIAPRRKKAIAPPRFDRGTSRLWALRASPAPRCFEYRAFSGRAYILSTYLPIKFEVPKARRVCLFSVEPKAPLLKRSDSEGRNRHNYKLCA